MIAVEILYDGSNIKGFTVEGHAEYAQYGEDIVCSSVSILTIGTINSIIRMCKKEIKIEQDDGYIQVLLPKRIMKKDEARILLTSMLYNLKDLEQNYPNNIQVLTK